jgi:beta-lactamase regulating signal transducer with metallopeptidase domain
MKKPSREYNDDQRRQSRRTVVVGLDGPDDLAGQPAHPDHLGDRPLPPALGLASGPVIWLLILIKLLIPPSWTLPSSLISRWQPLAQARLEQILDVSFQSPTTKDVVKLPALPSEMKTVRPDLRSSKETTATLPAGASPLTAGPRLGWKAVAMMGWILGLAVFTGLLAHRITRLRRWHKNQVEKKTIPVWYYEILVRTADRLKLGRLPTIVFSDEAKAPAVYGVFRPVLLLPDVYLDSLSEEDAEHVLLHELAHLKRGDLWLHGLFLLIQIVYWFNPLIIWARRQMKHVREVCCDLTVASLLKEKTVKYRETLLSTARELLTESAEPGMGLLGVFEDPFRLVMRLKWLEKRTWESRKLITATAVLVTLVLTAGADGKSGRRSRKSKRSFPIWRFPRSGPSRRSPLSFRCADATARSRRLWPSSRPI